MINFVKAALRFAGTKPPWSFPDWIRYGWYCVYVLRLENGCYYVGSTRGFYTPGLARALKRGD